MAFHRDTPDYARVNHTTLINRETREFKTFTKNAHEQLLIVSGKFWGLTYEVENPERTTKEAGNAEYIRLRREGWIKWQDYCLEKNLDIREYGYILW